MMKRGLILLTWLAFLGSPARAADLLVFAAASLKEPLDSIAAQYGNVTVSYAGSGTIARQVIAGAPADIVILAHDDWVQAVEDAGILTAPPLNLLSNSLVVIAPANGQSIDLTPDGVQSALAGRRMAMGQRDSVPAGIYGKAALTQLGLWDGLVDDLAEVDNVRTVLTLVARGEGGLGIVYATDARVTDLVRVVAKFQASSHPPIRYAAGQMTENAADFMTYLQGEDAQEIFAAAGFLPPVTTP